MKYFTKECMNADGNDRNELEQCVLHLLRFTNGKKKKKNVV